MPLIASVYVWVSFHKNNKTETIQKWSDSYICLSDEFQIINDAGNSTLFKTRTIESENMFSSCENWIQCDENKILRGHVFNNDTRVN